MTHPVLSTVSVQQETVCLQTGDLELLTELWTSKRDQQLDFGKSLTLIAGLFGGVQGARNVLVFATRIDANGSMTLERLVTHGPAEVASSRFEGVVGGAQTWFSGASVAEVSSRADLFNVLKPAGWLRQPDHPLIAVRFGDSTSMIGCAIVEFADRTKSAARTSNLARLGLLSEKTLAAFRAHSARQRQAQRGSDETYFLAALHLSVDGLWQSDDRGRIHNTITLRAETDVSLEGLHGVDVNALAADSIDRSKQAVTRFRDKRFVLSKGEAGERVVELSGVREPEGSRWWGIVRLANARAHVRGQMAYARDLISRLEKARDDEARQRYETDVLFEGLHLITQIASAHDIFKSLLGLLAAPLEFEDAVILQQNWNGKVVPCAATQPNLEAMDWTERAASLLATGELAIILRAGEHVFMAPGATPQVFPWKSGFAVRIMGGARPAYLVCLRHEEGFFGQSHLGLGLRFSIVANQAFLNEEERQKVVQSSKLAMLGEVAAGIAHEISQPLTAIKLAAQNIELMLETPEGPSVDKLHSKVERILSAVERSVKIVQSMRVLSRQSDGAQAPFNVKEAVSEATSIVQHKLTGASVRLSVDIPEALTAHGRRLEFSQVVLNAVSNAIDAIQSTTDKSASAKPDRAPEVQIQSRANAEGIITLTIRDTGPGIPKHLIDKVMDAFFTTKDVGKGTGLGLALCKRMMEAMSGEITINNWDGGAEVCLRLQEDRHNLQVRDGSKINGAV